MANLEEKNEKNILILATRGDIGGVQIFIRDLAKELKKQKVKVTAGFGSGDFLPAELERLHIPYHRFKYLKRSHDPLNNLKFIREFKKYLDKNKYSAIHINSSNALLGALAAKKIDKNIKTIFTVHGLSLLDENYRLFPALKSAYRHYFKYLFRFIDEPVFVSERNFAAAQAQRLCQKGTVVPNGIDREGLDFFDKEQARAIMAGALDHAPDWGRSTILGSIGRLSYQKNHEFLINNFLKILEINRNCKLIIVGDGPMEKQLKALAQKTGSSGHIFFAGAIPNASRLIKAFDIFLLPSRYEGLPITLIEAVSAGVPVLATDVGGNSEVLGAKEQLYGLDTQKEFLDKLSRLIKDEGLREKISRQNLEHAKNFTLKKMADEYLRLYQ